VNPNHLICLKGEKKLFAYGRRIVQVATRNHGCACIKSSLRGRRLRSLAYKKLGEKIRDAMNRVALRHAAL
jgi:hypothetical protein